MSVLIRGCEWGRGDHLKYKYEILSDPGDQIRYPADQIRFIYLGLPHPPSHGYQHICASLCPLIAPLTQVPTCLHHSNAVRGYKRTIDAMKRKISDIISGDNGEPSISFSRTKPVTFSKH